MTKRIYLVMTFVLMIVSTIFQQLSIRELQETIAIQKETISVQDRTIKRLSAFLN